jgi:hypothetical protein
LEIFHHHNGGLYMFADFNIMQFATYGGIAAVLTFLLSSGQRAKEFFEFIGNLWLEKVNLDEIVSAAVFRQCRSSMKLFGLRGKSFSGCTVQLNNRPDDRMAAFDILKHSNLCFRQGWMFLILKPGKWRYDRKADRYVRSIDMLMPRFMWNSDIFIEKCMEKYTDEVMPNLEASKSRFGIRRFYGSNKTAPNIVVDQEKQAELLINGSRELLMELDVGRARIIGHSQDEIKREVNSDRKPFDWYAFPDYIMIAVENARQWHCSREWFRSKRIPWRRGWLLHGAPGTGKTLLAKCLAQDLDMPVFIFDLASMCNEEFESYWTQAGAEGPCMILFEDFDAVFHRRENMGTGENKLTFDCVLNCISGMEAGEGIFLVITTNHIEHIDPSLGAVCKEKGVSTRPGRIDDVIHVGIMEENCRRVMAHRILGLVDGPCNDFVSRTEGMTAAQFIEFCNRKALDTLIDKKPEIKENRHTQTACLFEKESMVMV